MMHCCLTISLLQPELVVDRKSILEPYKAGSPTATPHNAFTERGYGTRRWCNLHRFSHPLCLFITLLSLHNRLHNMYVKTQDPKDGIYRDYSSYPFSWTHDANGFPDNHALTLHNEAQRQKQAAQERPPSAWGVVKKQVVTQSPQDKRKAIAALEKHFKKHKPNYFRYT